MKKLIALILFALMVFEATASTPTVTTTRKAYGGMSAYSFSFTTTAIGTGDTAVVVPSDANYFVTDSYNNQDPTLYFSSSETTLDSVRFTIVWQGKDTPSGTWRTLESVTADSALVKLDVFTQNTYGRWPLMRVLIISNSAKTAVQTITGNINWKKDL
jgi:hypothetical protein